MDIDTNEEKQNNVVIDNSFDESATFTGKVKFFKNSFRVTIVPDQDLSAIGVKNQKVEASCSDILSSQSPAILCKEQAVEFRLRKDNYGVYAIAVTGPGGSPVGPPSTPQKERVVPARTMANRGKTYTGTVKSYLWAQGFGYILLDNKEAFACPAIQNEKEKKKFEKTGGLWFARDDIMSTDTAVGVKQGEAVQFQVYTDEKGIGAMNVTRRGGAPFSGVRNDIYRGPPKKKNKKKKKGKQLSPEEQSMHDKMKNFMEAMGGSFGPVGKGGKKKGKKAKANMKKMQQMMMMNQMMMNPMMRMQMGGMGGMPMMMNMGGTPYMMMPVGGKKKKRKNKKKKNKTVV